MTYSWEKDNSLILPVADAKEMKQKCGIRKALMSGIVE
jgi:hypothetical protein